LQCFTFIGFLIEKIAKNKNTIPILKINKDARLSKPLLESSFDISIYSSSGLNTIQVSSDSKITKDEVSKILNFIENQSQKNKK
jgi:hypothetical protein